MIDLTNSEEGKREQTHTGIIHERYSPDSSNAHLFEDLEDDSSIDDIFGDNSSDNVDAMDFESTSDLESSFDLHFNQILCQYMWTLLDRLTPTS